MQTTITVTQKIERTFTCTFADLVRLYNNFPSRRHLTPEEAVEEVLKLKMAGHF